MGVDEVGTHARLKANYSDLVDPKIAAHEGRVVKLMGDGLLAEFPLVVNAVEWVRGKRPETLDAWDYYLRAIAAQHKMTKESVNEAIEFLEKPSRWSRSLPMPMPCLAFAMPTLGCLDGCARYVTPMKKRAPSRMKQSVWRRPARRQITR